MCILALDFLSLYCLHKPYMVTALKQRRRIVWDSQYCQERWMVLDPPPLMQWWLVTVTDRRAVSHSDK